MFDCLETFVPVPSMQTQHDHVFKTANCAYQLLHCIASQASFSSCKFLLEFFVELCSMVGPETLDIYTLQRKLIFRIAIPPIVTMIITRLPVQVHSSCSRTEQSRLGMMLGMSCGLGA